MEEPFYLTLKGAKGTRGFSLLQAIFEKRRVSETEAKTVRLSPNQELKVKGLNSLQLRVHVEKEKNSRSLKKQDRDKALFGFCTLPIYQFFLSAVYIICLWGTKNFLPVSFV